MKKVCHLVFMFTSLFFLAECKKSSSDSSSTPPSVSNINQIASLDTSSTSTEPTLQSQVQDLTASLKNQHLDFNAEYVALLQAIATYQKTRAYSNPQNDHQKLLNVLVPILSSLSDASAKQDMANHILAGDFQMFDQAFANMSDYASLLQSFSDETGKILASSKDLSNPPTVVPPQSVSNLITVLHSIPITVTDTEVQTLVTTLAEVQTQLETLTQTTTAAATTTETAKGKQTNHEIVLATGIFVFAVTGYALYHSVNRGIKIIKSNKGAYTKNLAANIFQDSALFGKSAALIFFSVMIMNGLITGKEINSEYIKDPIAIAGLLSALMTVYWIAEFVMNVRGKTFGSGGVELGKGKFYKLDIMGSIFGKYSSKTGELKRKPGMTVENAPEYKPKLKVFGQKISDLTVLEPHAEKIGYAKNIVSILGGALMTGASAYAYMQMGLANTNTDAAPEQVLMGALMRFYAVCQLLSQNKVLVLN